MLFGRNQKPVQDTVRAVLSIKGEPSTSENGKPGLVWTSIIKQIDIANAQDEFTSTADMPRIAFASHPWSVGGGGASELQSIIEDGAVCDLSDLVVLIGYICMTRADDVYFAPIGALRRAGFPDENIIFLVEGDIIRDWILGQANTAVFPYDREHLRPVEDIPQSPVIRFLWPYRAILWLRQEIGGTQKELGMTWHEWNRFQRERFGLPYFLAFAFVATHNHFVLEQGGKVFKQSAPIIKLKGDATKDDHLGLLGLFNSSVACFWMKQTFHDKGGGGIGGGLATELWEHFFEFTGTGLQHFPIPEQRPLALARKLEMLAQQYVTHLPDAVIKAGMPTAKQLVVVRQQAELIRLKMISLQEELDWHCYQLYGLLSEDLCYHGDDLPELILSERAFEIVMAHQIARGNLETTWFERHGSKPITEIPTKWPEAYRELVARRIEVIKTNKQIGLIEKPEYKRRWNSEAWEEQERRALRNWLLDRLESRCYWPDPKSIPLMLQTTAQITDKASGDQEFMKVAALYKGRADFDLGALVADLVVSEAVPFLPILRYKPSGLRKRKVWEDAWNLQRREDVGEDVGSIPPPPKYTTADFLKTDYWRLRGKLDVPKERWISYPHCSTESDPTLLVGWAGWNHLQQATAIVNYYDARKREGWDAKRLTPLLAGLDQLLPWIHQWHPDIDPEFGETAGQSYQTMLEQDAHELGLTLEEDIRKWQPPATTTRRRTRKN
jgi:hypothetical protein